jgi:hypothetical protein
MAGRDDTIERMARQAGDVETLKQFANKPFLRPHELFYFRAFNDLDSERAHGMSLARIPRSKIVEYADEVGLSENERYELIAIVSAMDAAWLEQLAKKRKNENAS